MKREPDQKKQSDVCPNGCNHQSRLQSHAAASLVMDAASATGAATAGVGRSTPSGQGVPAGQLSENQRIAFSNDRVLRSLPPATPSSLSPPPKIRVDTRLRLRPAAAQYASAALISFAVNVSGATSDMAGALRYFWRSVKPNSARYLRSTRALSLTQ
mgnify:CR=1 FL=1